ncbi:MAG: hypothetical protein FJX35_02495 [Alphaproteobacteria bacterium]|nr:hypothetical protein [Alphaproteobacteria bacterium]
MTRNFPPKPKMGETQTMSTQTGSKQQTENRLGSRWQAPSSTLDWRHKPADAQQTLFHAMKAAAQRRASGVC